MKDSERGEDVRKETDFTDRATSQGRECNSDTTEEESMCQGSGRREKRYFSPSDDTHI